MAIPEGQDGVDHINIYSQGETELGRLLSNFAHTPFVHPDLGAFESVEGLWYWLGASEEGSGKTKLRCVYGFTAKRMGRELPRSKERLSEEVFRETIFAAFEAKLAANPRIRSLLINSTLPLAHYYVYGKKGNTIKRDAGYEWQVEWWEKKRSQLQETVMFTDVIHIREPTRS